MKTFTLLPCMLTLSLLLLLLPGCVDTISGPETAAAAGTEPGVEHAADAASKAPAAPDVTGAWSWSLVTLVLAKPLVFELGLFGDITPEGPITRMLCPSSGTMTISAQSGGAFSGSQTQSNDLCTTQGGQTGLPPFPPFLDVVDGEIKGHSFSFTSQANIPNVPPIPCHYKGSISVAGGVAVEMKGTGQCEVPKEFGPPGKVLHFVATRP